MLSRAILLIPSSSASHSPRSLCASVSPCSRRSTRSSVIRMMPPTASTTRAAAAFNHSGHGCPKYMAFPRFWTSAASRGCSSCTSIGAAALPTPSSAPAILPPSSRVARVPLSSLSPPPAPVLQGFPCDTWPRPSSCQAALACTTPGRAMRAVSPGPEGFPPSGYDRLDASSRSVVSLVETGLFASLVPPNARKVGNVGDATETLNYILETLHTCVCHGACTSSSRCAFASKFFFNAAFEVQDDSRRGYVTSAHSAAFSIATFKMVRDSKLPAS